MAISKASAFRIACLISSVGLSACAGVKTSQYSYNAAGAVNQPQKSSDCYDASVTLAKSASASKDIATKVLTGIDATISEQSGNQIKAQRNRHIGVLVGSGGEELTVSLNPVSENKTFVTATTKTGFVGGAGQKAWSCQIVDEMVKMAK